MKTSTKIKLYWSIILALILLCISIVLIVITFSLVYWLHVKEEVQDRTRDNYGMWQGCLEGGDKCGRWYENGQELLNYYMTDSWKAFQATQVIYLAFTFFAFIFALISLHWCQTRLWMFVVAGLLLFIGTASGISSLIVFAVDIYQKSEHIFGWCYWVNLATVCLNVIALMLLCWFVIWLKRTPIDSEAKIMREFDYLSQTQTNTITSNFHSVSNVHNVSNVENVSNIHNIENISNLQNASGTIQEINQAPVVLPVLAAAAPSSVQVVRTEEIQSLPPKSSPKHTHYHSEYDLAKHEPIAVDKDGKKYHRRFNYRQIHKLAEYKKYKNGIKMNGEQFQPGYCSEPEIIEYSLDRCWVNADNQNPTSFETIESIDNSFDIEPTFPQTVYYDSQEHYLRDRHDNRIDL